MHSMPRLNIDSESTKYKYSLFLKIRISISATSVWLTSNQFPMRIFLRNEGSCSRTLIYEFVCIKYNKYTNTFNTQVRKEKKPKYKNSVSDP